MVLVLYAMHRQNIRAMALIVCTFTYLMIGAAIFDALESETDNRKRELVEQLRDKMMNKYNFSSADYRVLETVVLKSIPHKAGHQWRFAGAFYFATVVITTVGYGHSTPATTSGKAFCIFYALAGIPLNLVMFQSIGERLNALICYVLNKLKKHLKLNIEVSMTHMIMVSSSLGSLVVVFGTYLFSKYENWNWYDSFYYCFVTLTTIGFGDYVALQKDDALQNKTFYIICTLLFILFGMAIFAAAVNLLVLRFMATSSDNDTLEREQAKKLVLMGLSGHSDEDLATPNGHGGLRPSSSNEVMRISSFLDLAKLDSDLRETSFSANNETSLTVDKKPVSIMTSPTAGTGNRIQEPVPIPGHVLKRPSTISGTDADQLNQINPLSQFSMLEDNQDQIGSSPCSCACWRGAKARKGSPIVYTDQYRTYYTVTRAPVRVSHLIKEPKKPSYIYRRTTYGKVQSPGETQSFLDTAQRRPSL